MSDTYRAVIPYESLDPLTIGARTTSRRSTGTRSSSRSRRRTCWRRSTRTSRSRSETRRRRRGEALESPVTGPRFSELLAGKRELAIVIDNQFRPTPQSKLLPAVLRRGRGGRGRGGRRLRERQGLPDVRVGHRAEDRAREPRPHGADGDRVLPERAAQRGRCTTYVGVSSRGTPVWLHKEVARCDVKLTIGQAQSNHWGAGGGGKLILPGVVSDETIESNHCAFVPSPQTHYGAYAGPMRSDIDEVATMCGLD